MFRTLYPTTKYTFFSRAHGKFPRIYHILGCKASLNTFKRIEVVQNILSDHSKIKLEINNRMKSGKSTNICKLNNTFLSNPWVKEIIRVQKYFELSENKTTYQNL